MDSERLRETLEHLRAEINRAEISSEHSKGKLNALISDIEHKLEHPDDAEHHDTLVKNVKDSITHFELEHPRATSLLNQVMTTLGGVGI